MTAIATPYLGHDDDGLILHLHDMSMSADPETALYGRLLKALLPAAANALREEARRGTDPRKTIQGFLAALVNAGSIAVVNMSLERDRMDLAKAFGKAFAEELVAHVGRAEEARRKVEGIG